MHSSTLLSCVVLKGFDLGEADRILTVFSRQFGKISVMAKGLRRIKSRKAGSVEVATQANLFVAEGKNFFILQEVAVVSSFTNLKSSMGTLKYGYYVLELIDVLMPEHEAHETVFSLLIQILTLLDSHPRKIFIRAFEVKLMVELGYLAVDPEDLISGKISGSEFLSGSAIVALTLLQSGSWLEIEAMIIEDKDINAIQDFMKFRIEREGQRTINSLNYFD